MDNWRKLLNFELMEHRALAEMEQAVADLERAVGVQVDRQPRPEPSPQKQPAPSETAPGPRTQRGERQETEQ
jgi:hypothetical protein